MGIRKSEFVFCKCTVLVPQSDFKLWIRSIFVLGDPSDVYKRSDEALLYPRKPDLGDRTKHLVLFYPRRLLARGDVRAKDIRRSTRPIPPSQTWRSDEALGSLGKLTFPLLALRHLHPVITISIIITIIIIINLNVSYHQHYHHCYYS